MIWIHFSFSRSWTDCSQSQRARWWEDLGLKVSKNSLFSSPSSPIPTKKKKKNQEYCWAMNWGLPGEGIKDFRFAKGGGTTRPSWELLRVQVTLHWAGGIQPSLSCQAAHHSSLPSEPLSRPTLDTISWQVVYRFRLWAQGSFFSHLWSCLTL